MAWIDITASAHHADYNGYLRYANKVLNISGAMTESSPNGLCVYNIQPNTHYRVTMIMQNRFRLGCVPNLSTGQTVTNYIFDALDVNDATNQNTSRTLEITSEAGQVYLCVGMWSTGADDTLYNTLATIVVEEAQSNVTTYTVTFEDHDGTVLKTQTVAAGANATPPADPTRSGFAFTGWSGTYTNVQSDLTITAQYEAVVVTYTVTFKSRNDATLKTEIVNAGEDATPPTPPIVQGYIFSGWSGEYTNVQADITLTAQYRVYVTCTVTFKNYDGTVLKTETVERYQGATPPELPPRPGYVFTQWYGTYKNVAYDCIVTAQYSMCIYYLRFYDEDQTTLLAQASASYGYDATNECYIQKRSGKNFIGWSVPVHHIESDVDAVAQFETVPVYSVTFCEEDGTVLEVQQVNAGDDAYRKHRSSKAGYAFDGWGETETGDYVSNVQSNMTVNARYRVSYNNIEVRFYDRDRTSLLAVEVVLEGDSATPPTPLEHEGYIFYGWDTEEYKNVFSYYFGCRIDVYACYGIPVSTVTYYNGSTVLKTEQVPFGGNATPPAEIPVLDEDHVFSHWTNDGMNVHNNLDIDARFNLKPLYGITFRNYDKLLISSMYVREGQDATPPLDPIREGYTFLGWDGDYADVRSNKYLTARFAERAFTVTFLSYDGTVLKTMLVEEGADALPPLSPLRDGYTFVGWDGAYTGVQANMTLTAQYNIDSYIVTFSDWNGTTLKTQPVEHGQDATAPADPIRSGYRFTGWSRAYTNIVADLTVIALYEQLVMCTVRFLGYNGLPLKTQSVLEGSAATPPLTPLRTGYTFTGWSADVSAVTSNMVVRALYTRDAAAPCIEIYHGSSRVQILRKVTAASLKDALDGTLTLSFSTLADRVLSIQTGQIAKLGNLYFNIVRVQKSISSGLWLTTATCEHVSYVLNDDEYKLESFDYTGSPESVIFRLLVRTPLSVGTVEYTESATLQINKECTRRAALMQFIAILGGEIEYDGYYINVRAHRGSETPKQLMESRNVTNVGVTHDSRSATASYEISFFHLVDISVGDEVHIVFSPLGVDVTTRIISLEYNPFYRYNARVEIGDYVPTITDNLYSADTSAIEEQIEDLQTQLEEMPRNKRVYNIQMDEGTFIVSYDDGTTMEYVYFTDADGKIARITTGTFA